jgi:hypothetical protein
MINTGVFNDFYSLPSHKWDGYRAPVSGFSQTLNLPNTCGESAGPLIKKRGYS